MPIIDFDDNCHVTIKVRNAGITKHDLQNLKEEILMKLSELKGTAESIRGQVVKVAQEQQTRFDKLSAKIDELEKQLEDADVPTEVSTTLEEVKTLLQAVDDSIPDTEGVPTDGGPVPVGSATFGGANMGPTETPAIPRVTQAGPLNTDAERKDVKNNPDNT